MRGPRQLLQFALGAIAALLLLAAVDRTPTAVRDVVYLVVLLGIGVLAYRARRAPHRPRAVHPARVPWWLSVSALVALAIMVVVIYR